MLLKTNECAGVYDCSWHIDHPQIQFSTSKINHSLKILIIAESMSSTLDILNNRVNAFQKSIRKLVVKVIEYLFPVVLNSACKFFHGIQARTKHPIAKLLQAAIRISSVDRRLIDILKFHTHGICSGSL